MLVLTLALGIGANTAIFSVVKSVLINQLRYRQPGKLVKIAEASPDTPVPETIDFATTYDLRVRSQSFESLSLFREYFSVMRIPLKRGRGFTEADRKGAPMVAIITTYTPAKIRKMRGMPDRP